MKWLLAGILFLSSISAAHAQEFNAGFVQGLWYGDEAVFAGEPTRIYAAIRNNTGADLSGNVEFYVDGERIERRSVTALDGRIIESWADWEPNYGEHEVMARLTNIRLHEVGEDPERVDIETARVEDIIFVDYDTDGDGIGNQDDSDDDGDGLSDEEEEAAGTDPLDPNDPPPESGQENDEGEPDTDNDPSSSHSKEQSSDSVENKEGLEQFLTDSRADAALTGITDIVNNTKRALDRYREQRNSENDQRTENEVAEEERGSSSATSSATSSETVAASETGTTSTSTDSSKDGFGEVSRTKAASASSVFASIWELVKSLLSNLYTFVLFIVSLYLSHPIVVQLTLLLLILFLIFKVAKRLGSRPN